MMHTTDKTNFSERQIFTLALMINGLSNFIYRKVVKDMVPIVIKYPKIVFLFQIT